jgi:hypothetical protein
MTTWDRIRAALKREKRDVDDALDEFKTRAGATLDQRERGLSATPAEKMAIEQERAREIDADLDAVRKRIEGGS